VNRNHIVHAVLLRNLVQGKRPVFGHEQRKPVGLVEKTNLGSRSRFFLRSSSRKEQLALHDGGGPRGCC